jgi:hypothetical protein
VACAGSSACKARARRPTRTARRSSGCGAEPEASRARSGEWRRGARPGPGLGLLSYGWFRDLGGPAVCSVARPGRRRPALNYADFGPPIGRKVDNQKSIGQEPENGHGEASQTGTVSASSAQR